MSYPDDPRHQDPRYAQQWPPQHPYQAPQQEPWPPYQHSYQEQMPPPGRPNHRRKRNALPLLTLAAAALLAGAIAAFVVATPSHNTSANTAAAAAASPTQTALSCNQQYAAWKTGPARDQAKQLTSDLKAVQAAGDSEDVPELTSGLQTVGNDAKALEQYPMPACADPAGYWNKILTRVQAAGDNAGSSSGFGALMLAEAPLEALPGLESKLDAELKARHVTVTGS
jgi:hypothetical protein